MYLFDCAVLVAACGIYFPDQGLNSTPLHWEAGVLATGAQEKSYTQIWLQKFMPSTLYRSSFSTLS